MAELIIHPECSRWPVHGQFSADEAEAFEAGIERHKESGVVVTVWRGPCGDYVIDGRSSYLAAKRVGAKITLSYWVPPESNATPDQINDEIHYYTVIKNTNRRGASVAIAAMVCAEFLVEKHGEDLPKGEVKREIERTRISGPSLSKALALAKAGEKWSRRIYSGESLHDVYEELVQEAGRTAREKLDAKVQQDREQTESAAVEMRQAVESPAEPVRKEEKESDASEHLRKTRRTITDLSEGARKMMATITGMVKKWKLLESEFQDVGMGDELQQAADKAEEIAKKIGKMREQIGD